MSKRISKNAGFTVGAWALAISNTLLGIQTVSAEEKPEELNTVIVSATKIEKDESQLTQSVTVITEEDIQEKNFTDVTEILRETAGFQFKQASGPGQFNYAKLRGFSAGNILLVVDGVKINGAGSGDFGNLLGQIDPSTIERIEILRGPQAALYGANSTAGVIAITTKSGLKPAASVAIEGGSLDWKKGMASLRDNQNLGASNLAYSVNVSQTDSGGVIDEEFYKDKSAQAKISYSTETFEVGGSYWRTDNEFQYAELLEASAVPSWDRYYSFQLPDPDSTRATQQTVSSVWATHHINDQLSHTLKLGQMEENDQNLDLDNGLLGYVVAPYNGFTVNYFDFYNRDTAVPVYDSGSMESADNSNTNQQFDYTLQYAGKNTNALLGFERVEQNFRSWGRWGNSPENEERSDSFYVNGDHKLLDDHLVLSLGLRADDFDSWGNKTTGSTGIAYNFTEHTGVFINYGTSFKAPTLSQLYNLTYGSDALTPEEGKTIETGFRQHLLNDKLAWDITAWKTELDDVVLFDYSIPNPRTPWGFGQYANGDKQKTSGAELNGSYQIDDNWAVRGNYTYTDSHTQKVDADFERTVQVARNMANVGLNYTAGPVVADLNVYYVGPRLRWAADLETDSYIRTDISARYNVTKAVTLYGRIENLFDEEIIEEIGFEQPGRYAVLGAEYRFF